MERRPEDDDVEGKVDPTTGGSRQQVSIKTRRKTSLVSGICDGVTLGAMDTVRRMREAACEEVNFVKSLEAKK